MHLMASRFNEWFTDHPPIFIHFVLKNHFCIEKTAIVNIIRDIFLFSSISFN